MTPTATSGPTTTSRWSIPVPDLRQARRAARGPAAISTLWVERRRHQRMRDQNAGDPVVLYDNLADRWLLSQFDATGPNHTAHNLTDAPAGVSSIAPDPSGAGHRNRRRGRTTHRDQGPARLRALEMITATQPAPSNAQTSTLDEQQEPSTRSCRTRRPAPRSHRHHRRKQQQRKDETERAEHGETTHTKATTHSRATFSCPNDGLAHPPVCQKDQHHPTIKLSWERPMSRLQ